MKISANWFSNRNDHPLVLAFQSRNDIIGYYIESLVTSLTLILLTVLLLLLLTLTCTVIGSPCAQMARSSLASKPTRPSLNKNGFSTAARGAAFSENDRCKILETFPFRGQFVLKFTYRIMQTDVYSDIFYSLVEIKFCSQIYRCCQTRNFVNSFSCVFAQSRGWDLKFPVGNSRQLFRIMRERKKKSN